MPDIPSFREDHISQIPALQVLANLGYICLSPTAAMKVRGGKNSNVILDTVLEEWLRKNNRIIFKGRSYEFTGANIRHAVSSLKEITPEGPVQDNEKVYDLLCLGKSLEQTINGDKKSFSLRYIDWKNVDNNVFHAVPESGPAATKRGDRILFFSSTAFPLRSLNASGPI